MTLLAQWKRKKWKATSNISIGVIFVVYWLFTNFTDDIYDPVLAGSMQD